MASELFVDKIYPGPSSTSIEVNATSSFVVKTNGSTSLSVDSAGRLQLPKQPSCIAYLSTNQSLTSSTWQQINLNVTRFNIGSHFNTSTYLFLAPVAGKYFVSYSVNYASDTTLVNSGSYLYTSIKINGSFYHYGQGFRNSVIWRGDCTLSAGQLVHLEANDSVTLWAYGDGANTLASGLERCNMSVHLLA